MMYTEIKIAGKSFINPLEHTMDIINFQKENDTINKQRVYHIISKLVMFAKKSL